MIGKTLAHYEITSQLGKGGMGEVYQAKDLKLGRDVAIKVLPEEFAKDADRVARFQREAKLLASLNHPNIAAIYGLEESGGTNFLVLELVEGETLTDRIKAGPIPVEESLKLALQIAEAIEAAHEKSVIHRDLKPANIKVTPDGKVKVLDFGLAKAFTGDPEDMNLSNSPTLSVAATQRGMILGTAAYMSPEQAKGKSVGKQTDIWAFGSLLYEMLTGQAADGTGKVELLASLADRQIFPGSWSKNGNILTLNGTPTAGATGRADIYTLSVDGEKAVKPLLQEDYSEMQPEISPDGRWMAYVSDESGRREIYVRPFPEVNKGKWPVSTSGGDNPLWSPDGLELYFRNDDSIMAVSVKTEPTFTPGKPQKLFSGRYVASSASGDIPPWDISRDGKRFLLIKPVELTGTSNTAEAPRKMVVIVNWFEELKRLTPESNR